MGVRTRGRPDRIYAKDDLEVFNMLEHPVWVFDVDGKSMWWSNTSGLDLWNADCLDSLLSRTFKKDMSEATEARLQDYMSRFRRGETVTDQWTYYPRNRGPTTVSVTTSGIRVEGGRLVMLNEGILPSTKEESDREALRCVEMLRHLPVAV